jgi:hypothetical protein
MQPGSHRAWGEMIFEAIAQAVGELFLDVQLQAAVHPVKILHIGIIAISREGFEAPWKDRRSRQ